MYKIAIDGGFTCPNRDGTIDSRGCIFCSEGGSGEFASHKNLDIKKQIEDGKSLIKSKTNAKKFIVYFQAFTNTYAPINHLEKLYRSALIDDSIVGLSIATRPDAISTPIITLLKNLQKETDIYIELGLQTIHKKSADFIRRGYDLTVYDNCVKELNKANIPIITHLILGLPNETKEDILASISYVTSIPIQGIKLQLLHLLKGTDLLDYYNKYPFKLFTEEEYIDLIIQAIDIIPKHIVIHRLTGDGPKDLLIEPKWSLNKRQVLNKITKALKAQGEAHDKS